MNKLTTALTAITLTLGLSTATSASELEATDNSITTRLCMVAANGNKLAMQNEIKASGFSKKYVSTKVQCNDQSISEFVAQHGKSPEGMVDYLNRDLNTRVRISEIAKL